MKKNKYTLFEGTVQPIVANKSGSFYMHFGPVTYEREKPIISDSVRKQAQPIVDALNAGTMTEEQAKQALSKIWI